MLSYTDSRTMLQCAINTFDVYHSLKTSHRNTSPKLMNDVMFFVDLCWKAAPTKQKRKWDKLKRWLFAADYVYKEENYFAELSRIFYDKNFKLLSTPNFKVVASELDDLLKAAQAKRDKANGR